MSLSVIDTKQGGLVGSLQCRGIDVHFGGLAAISSVDFHANQDEIVGLIGPNGAGKTTLVNVMSGFHKPTMGEVWLGDVKISDQPAHWVSQNGVVRSFQAVRLFDGLTVAENIEVGCVSIGASRAQAQAQAQAQARARADTCRPGLQWPRS